MSAITGDLAVAGPGDALHGRDLSLGHHLDIGEVLTDGQDVLLQHGHTLLHVVIEVVTVGGLRGVNVPVIDRVARRHHLQHFVQSGRNHGAAGFGVAEESILVNFLRRRGVADENDVHFRVVPRQEQVKQHEEALRQILQRLCHRGRHVHQAEHDSLGFRLRPPFVAVICKVDGVDISDDLAHVRQPGQAGFQPRNQLLIRRVARFLRRDLDFQFVELRDAWTPQGNPACETVAHGAQPVELGRRALGGVASADWFGRAQIFQFGFDQVRQFQIFEKKIEKFLAAQAEDEIIFTFTVRTAFLAAAACTALRFADDVADRIFAISRQYEIALAGAGAKTEIRLAQSLRPNADVFAALDIGNLTPLDRIAHSFLDLGLRASEKTLAVPKAFGLGIKTAVDNMHAPRNLLSPTS